MRCLCPPSSRTAKPPVCDRPRLVFQLGEHLSHRPNVLPAEAKGVRIIIEFVTYGGRFDKSCESDHEPSEVASRSHADLPGGLLHMANRPAVNQALSRLAKAGRLRRICQGVYMLPIETPFGPCSPDVGKALRTLSKMWRETIVSSGGAAANGLRLTTQVPVRPVYLTSGPDRRLKFGALEVQLRHSPKITFPSALPSVMRAEGTFREKATAAHVYRRREQGRGERLSRHGYD